MRYRQQILGSSLLLVLTCGFTAKTRPANSDDLEEIRVKDVFDRAEFPVVRVAGVCDITASNVTCWDTSGKPFESLTVRLTAYYQSAGGANLVIRPGMKNRWVAVEREQRPLDNNWRFQGVEDVHFSGRLDTWRQSRVLEWSRVDLPQEQRFAKIRVGFSKQFPDVDLLFKKGASAELDKEKITITEFGAWKPSGGKDTDYYAAQGMRYQFSLKRQAKVGIMAPTPYPEVFDIESRGISAVDVHGKPITAATKKSKGQFRVIQACVLSSPDELVYLTNVDPLTIGILRFQESLKQKVIFEGLPADPLSVAK